MFKKYLSLLFFAALVACPTPKPPPPPPPIDTTTPPPPPPVDTTAAVSVNLGGGEFGAIVSVFVKNSTQRAGFAVTVGLAPKGQGIGAGTTDENGSVNITLPGAGTYIACARVVTVYCSTPVTFPLN